MLEPASVKGDDNILTMEVLSSRANNFEFDDGEPDKYPHGRFQGYNPPMSDTTIQLLEWIHSNDVCT